MTTISAKAVLLSRHSQRPDLLAGTFLLRYPRFIHAEFMTHRVFSRNAASSRAIPVKKLIRDVLDNMAVPIWWGANMPGMQAKEELTGWRKWLGRTLWKTAGYAAVGLAWALNKVGCHKQIVNRILEPFAHITVVMTSTDFSNFLALRDHPDAEPHIQVLAREIRRELDTAPVRTLEPGHWHLPFVEYDDIKGLEGGPGAHTEDLIKLSVARCASTSYKTVDGFDMTMERAIALHDKLVAAAPLHASPAEHQLQADEQFETHCGVPNGKWRNPKLHGNVTGFIQYRKTLPGERL